LDTVEAPCAVLLQLQDNESKWLAVGARTATVFFHFEKTCVSETGKRTLIKEFIEPLVSHKKHPRGLKACVPPGETPVDVQCRDCNALLDNSDDWLFDLYPVANFWWMPAPTRSTPGLVCVCVRIARHPI